MAHGEQSFKNNVPQISTIRAKVFGIPFFISIRSQEKDCPPDLCIDVWGDHRKMPARDRMKLLGGIDMVDEKNPQFYPLWESRKLSRALTHFANEIFRKLEENNILSKLSKGEDTQIFSCDTLIKKVGVAYEAINTLDSISTNAILAQTYGGKIGQKRNALRVVMGDFNSFKQNATLEDLKLFSILANLSVKDAEKASKTDQAPIKRVFNQHMDQNGFFSWYRKLAGPDGKLMATKYFGKDLPDNLNLDSDKVNFHPQFVEQYFGLKSIENPLLAIAAR